MCDVQGHWAKKLTWLFTHMTMLECDSVEIDDIYIV